MPSTKTDGDRVALAATVSILVAFLVMAIKAVAYQLTGSVALYSDALESVVNVVTAFAALIAVRVSARPADREHPFGHHKAEFFSAVLEGVLIIVAALLILREAYAALLAPRALQQPALGLLVSGLATAINGAWSWFLIHRGKRWRSPALVADGWHLLTDVLTSVGVIAGISLASVTGWKILDPLLAAAVALQILWAGYRIVSGSLSGLLDEAAPPEVEARIAETIRGHGAEAIQAHDIRTRHAGRVTFVEFHLVVPGSMTVARSHEICDRIEGALRAEVDGARVVIHVEPEHKAKGKGAISLRPGSSEPHPPA